ncbi:hypothetical protein PILCRDRAFT_91668 [Piloderma croceum F 1598]|uniref:Uncharacterized protein n=1 Tax=Piloderma croceum (strain F 1598) TaxID=765440 RepID=A0A0C3BFY9_PILCF|nr:hypothetical protein PILCRDRAFT_91668 [Piloderma croceum F 1598]
MTPENDYQLESSVRHVFQNGTFIKYTMERFLNKQLIQGPHTVVPTVDKVITVGVIMFVPHSPLTPTKNTKKVKGLIAYYYNHRKSTVPITTEQIWIDKPFSILHLTGWFSNNTKITSAFVVSDKVWTGHNGTNYLHADWGPKFHISDPRSDSYSGIMQLDLRVRDQLTCDMDSIADSTRLN